MGDVLAYSGALRRLAVEVDKIASDLRLLSSGPRAGHRRDPAARRAAGLVDHAGQGESVGARDGQPGLPAGLRLRRRDPRRLRRRAARAERDDAGDRVERAARHRRSSATRCRCSTTRCVDGHRRPTRRAAASCSIAAPRSRRRSARTSATPQTADIAKTAVKTGRSIAEIVRERKLMPEDKLAADPVARSDDVAGHSRARARSHETAPRGRRCSSWLALLPRRWRRSTRGCFRPRISGCSKVRIATRGSGPIRSWTRCRSAKAASSRTSAPAADGSRSGWRGASARTAASTPKTSSREMIEAIERRVEREGLQQRRHRARHADRSEDSRRHRSTPC